MTPVERRTQFIHEVMDHITLTLVRDYDEAAAILEGMSEALRAVSKSERERTVAK